MATKIVTIAMQTTGTSLLALGEGGRSALESMQGPASSSIPLLQLLEELHYIAV